MVAEMITKIGIPADAELFLRVIVASILGYMIGYERKNRDKSAGMRTHAIVALGAALMMVVSKYGFYDVEKVDSSRVAAQIVSGVGFLGAGVIFVRNNPPIPLEIGSMERDPAQLRRVYDTGRAVAEIQVDKIAAFVEQSRAAE